jgi:hypothetical protein
MRTEKCILILLVSIFQNSLVWTQNSCNVTFSFYEQDSYYDQVNLYEKYKDFDSNDTIFDLKITNHEETLIFEWPEAIGESVISKKYNGYEIICLGSVILQVDTVIIYSNVPYCKIFLDTSSCTVEKQVLIVTPISSFDSINRAYLALKQKLGGVKIEHISKRDEIALVQLCFTISFAIINGCEKCLPFFYNLRNDFSIFIYGLNSSDYMSCKAAIELLSD